MKTITTSSGDDVLVDDQDYAVLRNWTVYSHASTGSPHIRYAYVWIITRTGGKDVPVHQLLLGVTDGGFVDHADGNGLNNQRSNLRLCTRAQNRANSRQTSGRSTPRGVYERKHASGSVSYRACIRDGKKLRHLGTFLSASEAAETYKKAALEVFGGFAAHQRGGS